MTTYTPGPWHVTEDGFVASIDGRRVGYAHGNPRDVFAEYARVAADRALMASAPDMLAALEHLRAIAGTAILHRASLDHQGLMELFEEAREAAHAAIAKATGA